MAASQLANYFYSNYFIVELLTRALNILIWVLLTCLGQTMLVSFIGALIYECFAVVVAGGDRYDLLSQFLKLKVGLRTIIF